MLRGLHKTASGGQKVGKTSRAAPSGQDAPQDHCRGTPPQPPAGRWETGLRGHSDCRDVIVFLFDLLNVYAPRNPLRALHGFVIS